MHFTGHDFNETLHTVSKSDYYYCHSNVALLNLACAVEVYYESSSVYGNLNLESNTEIGNPTFKTEIVRQSRFERF